MNSHNKRSTFVINEDGSITTNKKENRYDNKALPHTDVKDLEAMLEGLVDIGNLDLGKFTCPCCGKELPIDSAVIRTITKSKHINTHSQGRYIVRTYQNTPYEIRLCPHCAKRSSILENVTIALLIIVPIIFSCLFAKNIGLFFVGIFASAIPSTFIIGLIIWLIDITNILGTRIDIKHARKCNAVNKGGDWWEL